MQPCSQPRYGFTLVSNPTSGLLLREMIVFELSRKYCVARRGRSSGTQQVAAATEGGLSRSASTTPTEVASGASTSLRSICSFSNRLAGLHDAPRPWIGAELCGVSSMTGLYFCLRLFSACRVLVISDKFT